MKSVTEESREHGGLQFGGSCRNGSDVGPGGERVKPVGISNLFFFLTLNKRRALWRGRAWGRVTLGAQI